MKLKHKEIRSLWYKKIFFYLKSGQSLSESVKTAATDIHTMYIYEELSEGLRFSDVCALSSLKDVFSQTEISLLRVGEQTGSIQSVCGLLSSMLKEQHIQKQKLIAALIYPVLVLIMAFGLLIMILVGIVPKIKPLFSSMKSIPVATKILLELSNHVIHFWYIDVIGVCMFMCTIWYIKKRTIYWIHIARYTQYVGMRMPYVKEVYLYWFIERWLQIAHISLCSAVSLVQSLQFAHEAVSNAYMQRQFIYITESVRKGNSCSEAMGGVDTILKKKLHDWISVIASGEKTGTLVEVFGVSKEHVSDNLKDAFDTFQKVIEPALIVLVGIMVLCICLSIILPMYQLTQSVQ